MGTGGKGGKARRRSVDLVLIAQLARRVGRSTDTIKRWEEQGLLTCSRDSLGRRVYDEGHVQTCSRLANLAILAQRRSEKLSTLADREPQQLSLMLSPDLERVAG